MSPTTLSRLGGIALIAGGLLFALGNLLHPLDHSLAAQAQPTWVAAHVTFLVGGVVMLLGLPAVYARQAARAGRFGLVCVVTLAFGVVGLVPSGYYEAFVVPVVGEEGRQAIEEGLAGAFGAITGLCFLGGSLLFALSTLIARVYPRPPAVIIALATLTLLVAAPFATPLAGLAVILSTAIWGVAFAWIGAAHLVASRTAAISPGSLSSPGVASHPLA